jgi:cysteinyl-tRNA synthetase
MKLYNTLTKKVEEIKPISPPKVTVYTCGPTVYDFPHVGNWFTFVRYDMLVRTLKASGYRPTWVMNITDVGHLVSDADDGEDKLEKGAKREGKTAWEVAKFYTDYFTQGLERLNFTNPTHLPKATDHIREQIELVKLLEQKGFTYKIDDGIYYDTSKFADYGKFAQLDLAEQQAGARISHNQQKRNSSDFALWKFSADGQTRDMEWDSPWGKGFPGWHLECSAMSMKYLGATIDIHSGGIDHIPVHHTNEIAQSQAATGKPLASTWMHTNHILVSGDKISKSLGNGITLEDVEAKGYTTTALRLHILESHYRSQSKFSWESLESAKNRLAVYQAMADRLWQPNSTGILTGDLHQIQSNILEAAQDDLNTPRVVMLLSQLSDAIDTKGVNSASQAAFREFLVWLDDLLGLELSQRQDIGPDQKQILAERQKARDIKDWANSDKLRDKLAGQGISVQDTSSGQTWTKL